MRLVNAVRATACFCMLIAACGCARDASPRAAADARRAKVSFDAARARCGVTVAETAEVQKCMRAQGWNYRLPWQ